MAPLRQPVASLVPDADRAVRCAGIVAALISAVLVALLMEVSSRALVNAGAGALLHPSRVVGHPQLPEGCVDTSFDGAGVVLRGWRCTTDRSRRGTLIYLHGVADSRAGGGGIVDHFRALGFDVVAYDSRAHGASQGEACTYGFFEKQDLHHVVDTIASGPLVLLGNSLGAAVALQEAAIDARVTTVVAAETFSDLRTVAAERAPFYFSRGTIDRAFLVAQRDGHFTADEASPLRAAPDIKASVLLIHGDADTDTPPAHSKRVFAALLGKKRLLLVPGAHHNESLRRAWDDVERWIDETVR
jgi:alpha-beta hydrolase superfamily lysophospholipase